MANTPGPPGSLRFLWGLVWGQPCFLCHHTVSFCPTTRGLAGGPAPSVSGREEFREGGS